MPHKDPEQKKSYMREWRARNMGAGYGKWLYERRKLRFIDAEKFREVLEEITAIADGWTTSEYDPETHLRNISTKAHVCLEESRMREDALGPWKGKEE